MFSETASAAVAEYRTTQDVPVQGYAELRAKDVGNILTMHGMSSSNGDDFVRRMEKHGR